MTQPYAVDVTPSASRLSASLRDIGYDFVAALADVVDNSVAAGATTVDVVIEFDGADSYVIIADDGHGMTEAELGEALRFGSRREYERGELGRYGLGLKTASLSQCRRLTVYSRRAPRRRLLSGLTLDLGHIEATDRWEVVHPAAEPPMQRTLEWLADSPGTVVFWEQLDRVLPDRRPEGGWARRRLEQLASRSAEYLGMVFHRFLEGASWMPGQLTITVNGEKVRPWNPFAPVEDHCTELQPLTFEVNVGSHAGEISMRRFVLPPRRLFSSLEEFERLGGPGRWNKQQGLYVYRSDRLIQYGGWSGVRAADEHTKFARAALDFDTDLDGLFQINVAKMRVALPAEVRTLIEQPVHELCRRADSVYRREQKPRARNRTGGAPEGVRMDDAGEIGASIISAAFEAGEHEALGRIMQSLRHVHPSAAQSLGW